MAMLAAVIVAVAGVMIVWSNPARVVNRAVFFGTLQMSAWLVCWHLTATARDWMQGLFWLRWTCAIGALMPLNFWVVKECILLEAGESHWTRICRGWPWLLVTILLASAPFCDFFIPPESTRKNPVYGWGYYVYIWGLVSLYALLFRDAFRQTKLLNGGRKLEIQVWLGGGCILAGTVYLLMALSAITKDPIYRRFQPLAVLLFYAGTAYWITTYRIFDARQIVLVATQRFALVALVSGVAVLVERAFSSLVSESMAFVLTIGMALWLAAVVKGWLDSLFEFYPQGTAARQAAFTAAQRESRIEKLEASFRTVLRGWGQTEHVVIIAGSRDALSGDGIVVSGDSPVLLGLKELAWATPERLLRERRTANRQAVQQFLADHKLGVLVISEGPSLTTLIGVGIAASRRPYTYPQVAQLIELSSIMEGALERAHFSAKVQHTEQLATVGLLGASLAHEIRNPLVSIKTFVQLLPTHHHDPRFREKFFKLIGDEVGRIDGLTEQLLDLASPRTYAATMVELHPLLRSSLDLVAAKAAHRNIQLLTEFDAQPDRAFTDASAAKQVMLNLCFNAIQAVESHECDDRWVKVATRNTSTGVEMMVADNGPGIAPEIRPKLFQPFQTTKSTGFGLGLAICSDILANLNASITVDPPEPGRGATFRVIFPCQPLSS